MPKETPCLPSGYLTISQAADLSGVPADTLYRWTQRGWINRSDRFPTRVVIQESDLESFLKSVECVVLAVEELAGRGLKTCLVCREVKEKDEFSGRHRSCNDCRAERLKRERDRQFIYNLEKYNLLPGEYKQMVKNQKGRCAICKKKPDKKRLAVDHCHATGAVRGLLCHTCNMLLGWLENAEWREAAEKYLAESETF